MSSTMRMHCGCRVHGASDRHAIDSTNSDRTSGPSRKRRAVFTGVHGRRVYALNFHDGTLLSPALPLSVPLQRIPLT